MSQGAQTDRPESGGPTGEAPAGLSAPLRKLAVQLAKQIRQEHGLLDRPTADRFSRLLRASVSKRRKPGRKTAPEVLKAVGLRDKGVPWPQVCGELIPGYWKLSYPERFWRSTRLRDAVRAHRRRRAKAADRPRRRRPKSQSGDAAPKQF